MSNIWATRNKVFNKPNRNVFDHSKQNNLTMKQGYLTPVLCKEVLPGDSIRIGKGTMAAFNMLPMTFPVQTRMKLNTHFFYVRNRTLWKDFPDFFTNSKKDLVPPYLDFANRNNKEMLKMGSLLDYLNVPVTVPAGSFSTAVNASILDSPNTTQPIYMPPFIYGGLQMSSTASFGGEIGLAPRLMPALYSLGSNPLTSLSIPRGEMPTGADIDFLSNKLRTSDSVITLSRGVTLGNLFTNPVKAATSLMGSPTTKINLADLSIRYQVPLSDIKSDSTLNFELRLPTLVGIGTPSNPTTLLSDSTDRLAKALHKLSIPYISFVNKSGLREILLKVDTSSIGYSFDDNYNEHVLTISAQLNSENYEYFLSRSDGSTIKSLYVNFFVYPLLGDLSYKTSSGSLTKVSYTENESEFGWLTTFSAITNVEPDARFPYGLINSASYSIAESSDQAPRSFVRTRTLNSVKNLIDEYDSSPYYDSVDHPDGLKVSSLPLRAYEFIYNAFYRDSRNNPFMIDGVPEYNKYLTSDDGGADTNNFNFYRRNWEADHLTTACTTPQLGDAPLVGITSSGVASFTDVDGTTHEVQLVTSPDDDDTITSWKTSNVPNSVQRTLVNLATSGVSISDFRNVNALQRWLELNLRAGIRYKDVIKERWGMRTRYDDALLPEFLGGFSTSVDINMISNTNGDGSAALGDYAGQGSCFGKLSHNISCVCDEPGFIIGIASITPTPVYSQLLPKHFLKSNVLDYFQPEFGNISLQPITYSHVCPVEAKRGNLDFSTVFGYQRAWWEYLSDVDEVHGQFRGDLRNFLVNRVFSSPPSLTPDFLVVDPDSVNDIFVVDESVTDPFLGQFRFDISMKRPIPRYGIPQIEDASTTAH